MLRTVLLLLSLPLCVNAQSRPPIVCLDFLSHGQLMLDQYSSIGHVGCCARWKIVKASTSSNIAEYLQRSGRAQASWLLTQGGKSKGNFHQTRLEFLNHGKVGIAGLVFSFNGEAQYLYAALDLVHNKVIVVQVNAGSVSILAEAPYDLSAGVWYTLRIDLRDARIAVILNSKLLLECGLPANTPDGPSGLWASGTTKAAFQYLCVGQVDTLFPKE